MIQMLRKGEIQRHISLGSKKINIMEDHKKPSIEYPHTYALLRKNRNKQACEIL